MDPITPVIVEGQVIDVSTIPKIQPSPVNKMNLISSLAVLSPRSNTSSGIAPVLQSPVPSNTQAPNPTRVESAVPIINMPQTSRKNSEAIIRPMSRVSVTSSHGVASSTKVPSKTVDHSKTLITEEQQNEINVARGRKRATLLKAITTIKDDYPELNISAPPDGTPLEELESFVNDTLERIESSQGVDFNRLLLVCSWAVIELLGKALGFDMKGYAESQYKAMKKYRLLMIQLGEKKIFTTNQGIIATLPTEFKLMFLSLLNAIFFIGAKWLSKFLGWEQATGLCDSVMSYINGEDSYGVLPANPIALPSTDASNQEQSTSPKGNDFVGKLISSVVNGGGLSSLMSIFSGMNGGNGGGNSGASGQNQRRDPYSE